MVLVTRDIRNHSILSGNGASVRPDGSGFPRFDTVEVSMSKIYRIRDLEDGFVYPMTLPMILKELNRDRSDEWTNYDETDWREGLAEFTTYEVIDD